MLHNPSKGEHTLVVGQTGSGKSVMLQELIRRAPYSPVFIMDSKLDDGFLGLNRPDESVDVLTRGFTDFRRYVNRPPRQMADYVIIRPTILEVSEPEMLDEYLFYIYSFVDSPCIIVVDELYMLHKNGRAGRGLSAILTRGRSKGHSLMGATQRPAWVSGFCLSEATHFFVFRLVDINDRKRLVHIGYNKDKLMERYHYYCYDASTGDCDIYDPLDITDRKTVPDIKSGWL